MSPKIYLGPEKELQTVSLDTGMPTSAAPIFNDPENRYGDGKGDVYLHEEGKTHNVELNIHAASSLGGLHYNLIGQIGHAINFAERHGIALVPSSENGLGRFGFDDVNLKYERVQVYRQIFGDDLPSLFTVLGDHLHIDRHPNSDPNGPRLSQYLLMDAMYSLIAFASTSPINYRGENSYNCQRSETIRGFSYQNNLLSTGIEPAPKSLDELHARDTKRRDDWIYAAVENGADRDHVSKIFPFGTVGYQVVRSQDRIGKFGTFEFRALDNALPDVQLACAAIFLGSLNQLYSHEIPLQVANTTGDYKFSQNGIVVPNHEYSLALASLAAKSGLKDDNVHAYLTQVVNFAKAGLKDPDKVFLSPLEKMLESRHNLADDIMSFARSRGSFGNVVPNNIAAEVNLYLASRLRDSIR